MMAKVFARETGASGEVIYLAIEVQSQDVTDALVAAGIVPKGLRLLLWSGASDPLTLEFERSDRA